ncbi:MAG: helix-turn-helix domain-containing protein [Phycisphaerales bacterium]
MSRPKAHLVSSPKAWEVLVSPVRTEIAEALRLVGPCPVSEIAQVIDRPADTLYRHIELLQKAGFVREVGFRKGARHAEVLLDVVADDFVVDFQDNQGNAENRAIIQTVSSFTSAVQRAVRDSAKARQLVLEPDGRNISINYELSWLTPEKFQEVRALIRRLKKLMDSGKKRREGRLYMTLAIATPVTRKRGARPATSESREGPVDSTRTKAPRRKAATIPPTKTRTKR